MVILHMKRRDHHHQHHHQLTDDHRGQRHGGRRLAKDLARAAHTGLLSRRFPRDYGRPRVIGCGKIKADLPRVGSESKKYDNGAKDEEHHAYGVGTRQLVAGKRLKDLALQDQQQTGRSPSQRSHPARLARSRGPALLANSRPPR